jgi:hypothetical protein
MTHHSRFRSDFPELPEENGLDHILAAEETILPTSGFAASVMDAVRSEAVAPPPIPFPWKRAWPGLAAAALALATIVLAIVATVPLLRIAPAEAASPSWNLTGMVRSTLGTGILSPDTKWTALGLLLSAVSIWFSLRLTARTGNRG